MTSIQKNSRLYGLLIAVLAVAVVFKLTQTVNERLRAMPVHAVSKKEVKIAELDTKNLYPVVVRQQRAPSAESQESALVDDVFREKVVVQEAPAAPPPPDFTAIFAQNLRLDATTPTGAFVNGRYYQVGQPMEDLALVNGAESIVPRLVSVRGGSAVVGYGSSGRLTIRVADDV